MVQRITRGGPDMTSRDICELNDEELELIAGGKGASGATTSSFWTTLGAIVLGPLIGTSIGKGIGGGACSSGEDAA